MQYCPSAVRWKGRGLMEKPQVEEAGGCRKSSCTVHCTLAAFCGV
jgi:hypothetical protein